MNGLMLQLCLISGHIYYRQKADDKYDTLVSCKNAPNWYSPRQTSLMTSSNGEDVVLNRNVNNSEFESPFIPKPR